MAPAAAPPRRRITIVCPVYNEEQCVPPFYERLMGVLEPLRGQYEFDLLFTNNRSTDTTAEKVLELRQRDPSVQLLTLSRNFGYQNSVLAGIRQAAGDALIVIDVDCEDPPEMIPQFIAVWNEGYDVVYGKRERREEFFGITWMRKLFYRLNRALADSDIILDMAEFALITSEVRDAVASSGSTNLFIRAEVAHYGFRRKGIAYDRQRRILGKTHYNLYRMTEFAVAGMLSSTTAPLRVGFYLLPVVVVSNAVLLLLDILGVWSWGFKLLVSLDFIYVSTALAFISLYTARNYRNVIARPTAVVDWRLSAVNAPPERSPNALRRLGPRP